MSGECCACVGDGVAWPYDHIAHLCAGSSGAEGAPVLLLGLRFRPSVSESPDHHPRPSSAAAAAPSLDGGRHGIAEWRSSAASFALRWAAGFLK